MNREVTISGLRHRGYPPGLAVLAVARAGQNGHYDLTRHVVTLTGDAEYRITPLPWAGGGEYDSADGWPQDIAGILEIVGLVDAHLDSSANPEYQAQPLAQDWARITKVCEEAGEVWKAQSKRTGENPRKGVSGTTGELLGELGDTASAALCAIQHITKDADATWLVFLEALDKARSRVPAGLPFPPESGMTGQDAIGNGITR
jgi:hypothetical protein